jgi:hypothetical protein
MLRVRGRMAIKISLEKTEVGRLDPYYQDTPSILRTHEGLESLQRPLADSPAHSVEL